MKFQNDKSTSYTGNVERIIFYSETNHYTVARFYVEEEDRSITITGNFPNIREEERFQVFGEWMVHKRFGQQFQVQNYHPLTPNTLHGIAQYLASGIFEGIGKGFAEKIVAKFGLETMKVLEEQPHRLKEIPRLGKKRIQALVDEMENRRAQHSLQIFLRGLGITGVTLQNIYKTYGDEAMEVIKKNPYILIDEVSRIGFKRADQIAQNLGISTDDPQRGKAALRYTLQKAIDEGSTCLPQDELLEKSHRLSAIGMGLLDGFQQEEIERKILVEEDGYVYLPFMRKIEISAAKLVLSLVRSPSTTSTSSSLLSDAQQYTEEQREAIQTALREKILILTGGPGVGKTYTLLGIARILQQAKLTLALCAPTGRAAKRMQEATGMDAKTIHRLLKYQPPGGFYHNQDHPLKVDAVIVDESSMIDIFLFSYLLRALPPHARLIMVGDKDQLPPVGPGTPFCDLIESGLVPVVHLTKIFRQKEGSLIIQNAHKIRRGEMPTLDSGPREDFQFIKCEDPQKIIGSLEKLLMERIPAKLNIPPSRIQVLTPMRRGTLGYENLNQHLQSLFNPAGKVIGAVGPYLLRKGDKVMQIKNNYDKEVFNGDIGLLVEEEDGKGVVNFGDHTVNYDAKELKQLVLAYAISIHKSQGSEYPCVLIPIAPEHTILLRRNLIYTGLTRGMNLVVLIGFKKSVALAVQRAPAEKRYGRLLQRLQEKNETDFL